MAQVPQFSRQKVLQLAEERIEASENAKNESYEYYVGAWTCSMLARHFQEDFLITPEMFNRQTNKKPDFTIEKYDETTKKLVLHTVVEIKKARGDYLEKALEQVIEAIQFTGDEIDQHETFVVIQRGLKIGFFEFFTFYHDDLNKRDIDHFRGCVPLLFYNKHMTEDEAPHPGIQKMRDNIPEGVERLLTRQTKEVPSELLDDADSLQTPCIFDLKKHKDEIDLLFHHMATSKYRSVDI